MTYLLYYLYSLEVEEHQLSQRQHIHDCSRGRPLTTAGRRSVYHSRLPSAVLRNRDAGRHVAKRIEALRVNGVQLSIRVSWLRFVLNIYRLPAPSLTATITNHESQIVTGEQVCELSRFMISYSLIHDLRQ